MNTTHTAIFLGAGASCPFGFPDTSGLLKNVLKGLAEESLFDDSWNSSPAAASDNLNLMRFLNGVLERLLPGLCEDDLPDHLPTVTEILSWIDYSLLESKPLLPGLSHEEALQVRSLLERAIYQVMWDKSQGPFPPLLSKFVRWIEAEIQRGCGVITTNYDTYLEQELYNPRTEAEILGDFDFGFAWLDPNSPTRLVRARPENPRVRWLKLHGSMNWLRCPACEHIFISTFGNIVSQAFRNDTDSLNTCNCGDRTRLQLHLVTPSMYRTVRDSNLLEVWKSTLQLLIEAKHWVFIGYSLPSEDIAIRSLLVRAYHSQPQRPKITVIQKGNEALPRYEMLFGKTPRIVYQNEGLESWLKAQTP